MSLQILPLAITMMAGPQIMSAIIFVTAERAVRVSVAFLIGVAVAAIVGVAIAVALASIFGDSISLGDPSDNGSTGNVVQIVLVGLLILGSLKNYRGRATAEPPKWLGTLQAADPLKAFETGLLVILVMPSDIVIMLTVGLNLERSDLSFAAALPFIGLTVLVAALPLLAFLTFHRRAKRAMPMVRDWMNDNSWLVNIIVFVFFIVLILAG